MQYRHATFMVSGNGVIRVNNEDSISVVRLEASFENSRRECSILAVADGIADGQFGEQASAMAISTFVNGIFHSLVNGHGQIRDLIQKCFLEAHGSIIEKARKESKYNGMGTTLTVAIVDGLYCYIGNVGDSRCYLFRMGKIVKLTKDQSDHGFLEHYLGAKTEPSILTSEIELKVGDCLLVCSDGLTNMVDEDSINEIVKRDYNLRATAHELLNQANSLGGKDNISIALLKILRE